MNTLYEYNDYRQLMIDLLEARGRGSRRHLALKLGCGQAFISQVLQGNTHLSQEYALTACEHFELDPDQSHFFMQLVLKAKAGSKRLESYYEEQIKVIRENRKNISTRVGESQELSLEDQLTYYSAWYYSAIHVLVSIPALQNRNKIAEALKLPLETVSVALDFLAQKNLITNPHHDHYLPSSRRLHLDKNSPMISKHHSNWRLRAVRALEENKTAGLHFSGVWSFAEEDREKIEKLLLEAIERAEPILRPSPEEVAYGICIDFFKINS